jgi:hypothetical protein
MGLDMYLYATLYTSKYSRTTTFRKLKKMFPEVKLDKDFPAISVEFKIGYWRKANAIHNWFVNQERNKLDDCKPISVSKEQLKVLRGLCEKVLKSKKKGVAKLCLPTQSGFFFGTTDYDSWYFKDLQNTIEIIDDALKLPDDYGFYYQASW